VSVEENKALIRRVFEEVLNQRNVAVIDEAFAPDSVDHSAWEGQAPGPAGVKEAVSGVLDLFPDLRVTVESAIGEGDHVATRETWRGTHAPTGKPATGTVMHLFRLSGGRIAEEWSEGWGWFEQLTASD